MKRILRKVLPENFDQIILQAEELLTTMQQTGLERERVNGVVMNTEAWYGLFDVQPGQKLYRAPENRIHIW